MIYKNKVYEEEDLKNFSYDEDTLSFCSQCSICAQSKQAYYENNNNSNNSNYNNNFYIYNNEPQSINNNTLQNSNIPNSQNNNNLSNKQNELLQKKPPHLVANTRKKNTIFSQVKKILFYISQKYI